MRETGLPQFSGGAAGLADKLNVVSNAVTTINRTLSRTLRPADLGPQIGLPVRPGVIVNAGPNGEADYADNRYWVRMAAPAATDAITDTAQLNLVADETPSVGMYVTATNLAEQPGSHTLPTTTDVPVMLAFVSDLRGGSATRWYFVAEPSVDLDTLYGDEAVDPPEGNRIGDAGTWTETYALAGGGVRVHHVANGTQSSTLALCDVTDNLSSDSTVVIDTWELALDANRHVVDRTASNRVTLDFTDLTTQGFGQPSVHARYHYGPSTATAAMDITLDNTRDWRHYNAYAQVRAASTIDKLQHNDRLVAAGNIKACSTATEIELHGESADGSDYIQGQLFVQGGTNGGKLILRLTPHITGSSCEGYVDAVVTALSEVSGTAGDYTDVP